MTSPTPALGDPRALDVAWLRSQMARGRDEDALVARIREHLDEHDGYVSVSGGKDSLVTLHLAVRAERNVPVVFFDSGLEFPETIAYLDQLEDFFGVTITTYRPRVSLLDVLVASGAWSHQAETLDGPALDRILIHEPAARAAQDFGPGVLWGVRAAESRQRANLFARQLPRTCACCPDEQQRRARHGGVSTAKAGVRYSPIWDWSDRDVFDHIARHQLPLNPVYAKLRALGAPERALRVAHMVDGAHLERGRMVWLKAGWPGVWAQLVEVLPRLRDFV